MRTNRFMLLGFALIACVGMVIPRQGLAANPFSRRAGQTMDVSLHDGGLDCPGAAHPAP